MSNAKKYLPKIIPYVLVFWLLDWIGQYYHMSPGLLAFIAAPPPLSEGAVFSFAPNDLLFALVGSAVLWAFLKAKSWDKKNFRKGSEYGSARWGKHRDIAPFVDPVYRRNILLTQTERLMLAGKPKNPEYARNKNIMVVGGSGTGKTRFFVKPNLMQMNSSYVLTDPKGSVVRECGRMFQNHHYRIKIFNTTNFKKSMHYNPFAYIHNEVDILKFATALMVNTKRVGTTGSQDPFWDDSCETLYCSLIGYIHYEARPDEQNMATMVEMLDAMQVMEDDETYKDPVDMMFDTLAEKDPEHFAVRQYRKYKQAAGKTAKSILVSCSTRLKSFDIKQVREITSYDEMELDKLGDRKTVLFVVMSDTDKTFNFLIALMFTQMFNLLCEKADDKYDGELPVPVQCIIDEFANIGKIPDFETLIATIRSRRISACPILQTQSQLKANYKDHMDTIIGNCDTYLFLGGREKGTLKDIVETIGKQTIHLYNTSDSRGNSPSYGINYQTLGRELMTVDEIAQMRRRKCILQISGVRPFFSDKYDITKHPMYQELSDYNRANKFDVQDFVECNLKLHPQDVFDTYEYNDDESDSESA